MAAAAAAGPRAKRLNIPKLLMEADSDEAMDIKSLSQFVRDLCRQHKFDRDAWEETAETINDHARHIDELNSKLDNVGDVLLQVNNEAARVIDGAMASEYLQSVKHNIENPATLLV